MVKNSTGGKGSKSMARKNEVVSVSSGKLRLVEEEGEVYAMVTKAYGNCIFGITTITGAELKLKIRGKFSGRNKRNNFVTVGTFVLVGMRMDESNSEMCDLLEMYSDVEVKRLSSILKHKFFEITANKNNTNNDEDDELGGMFNYVEGREQPIPQDIHLDTIDNNNIGEEEEINIDDI